MIDADALAVHLNPLQEAIQPEGDVDASGHIDAISELSKSLKIPIIAKETGAGIKAEDAVSLENAGVSAIDIAGAGGTSWAAVETYRAQDRTMGDLYWDWGIPTAASTVEVCQSVEIPVISSGGIRSGLDAAKAIALGADAVGIALPLLKEAYKGSKAVINQINKYNKELRVAMFLVGASNIAELRKSDLIIRGDTREWLTERGFETKKYAEGMTRMSVEVIAVGGYEEVGKNMSAIKVGEDVVIFDMGIHLDRMHIHEDTDIARMHSLDLIERGIIPDDTLMKDVDGKVRAIVFTHGHLDHIGAVAKLAHRMRSTPLIATPYTMALIEKTVEGKGSLRLPTHCKY